MHRVSNRNFRCAMIEILLVSINQRRLNEDHLIFAAIAVLDYSSYMYFIPPEFFCSNIIFRLEQDHSNNHSFIHCCKLLDPLHMCENLTLHLSGRHHVVALLTVVGNKHPHRSNLEILE
jgi:hypothetical protein